MPRRPRPRPRGVAVLAPSPHGVSGVVFFEELPGRLRIRYEIRGLPDGLHGFHIHECGDLTEGCTSACAHFNPRGCAHGGPRSRERHAGDLGNISSEGGVAAGSLSDRLLRLRGDSPFSVLGRMVIVHADRDDLGRGGDAESLLTGNAGARVGCGVIGWAAPEKTGALGSLGASSSPGPGCSAAAPCRAARGGAPRRGLG